MAYEDNIFDIVVIYNAVKHLDTILKEIIRECTRVLRDIDIKNRDYCPDIDEISEYIRNSLFDDFCEEITKRYNVESKIEFSKCSWESGWNIKLKKSGKTLCTVYPKEGYFTVLVVIGMKEKEATESNHKRKIGWRNDEYRTKNTMG